jgi:hypothetical protein
MALVTRTSLALERSHRDLPNRVNRDEVCTGHASQWILGPRAGPEITPSLSPQPLRTADGQRKTKIYTSITTMVWRLHTAAPARER